MRNEKGCLIKIYVWLFAGILFAAGIAAMKVNGSFELQDIMIRNNVYDFSDAELKNNSEECSYDLNSNTFTVQGNKAKKKFGKITQTKKWNYLDLTVSDMNAETSEWIIVYYDSKRQKLWDQTAAIVNGENLIALECPTEFCRIRFIIKDQPGLTFSLQKMQLRMNETLFDLKQWREEFLTICYAYVFISGVIVILRKKNPDKGIIAFQEVLSVPGNYFGSRMGGKLKNRQKEKIRIFLFFLLFSAGPVATITGSYWQKEGYKTLILICTLLIFFIAFFSWEKPLYSVRWDTPLQKTWFSLWIMICISDFIVSKYFGFVGWVFLFAGVFLFLTWNHMEHPKRMLKDMIYGAECTFWVFLVYTLIFRQRIDGLFYSAAFAGREDVSLFALMMFVIFLAELYSILIWESTTHGYRIACKMTGAGLSLYFLYRAHFKIFIIAAEITGIAFLLCILLDHKKRKKDLKKNIVSFLIAAGCMALAVMAFDRLSLVLPGYLGTNVTYATEQQEMTEKDLIAENYIRNLNFFGNEDPKITIDHEKTNAYSGILEMAYRYGIFILIPYLLLWICCLIKSWTTGGYLLLGITLAFGIMTLFQNMEMPFAQPLWIMFYLGAGKWFLPQEKEKSNY